MVVCKWPRCAFGMVLTRFNYGFRPIGMVLEYFFSVFGSEQV